jgi:hypothetical protein
MHIEDKTTLSTSDYCIMKDNDYDDSYESDARFIEYISLLCKHSRNSNNLTDASSVFKDIRSNHGW